MAQFTHSICGDGFEQKSRLERHMATSRPPRVPSASDVENVLAGIQYPKSKEGLIPTIVSLLDFVFVSFLFQDLLKMVMSYVER
jgi:hypothetical protein